MATTGEIIASGIGGGMGMATIWFPITYFAMRKQFGLRQELFGAWRSYIACVIIFALLQIFGFDPSIHSPAGIMSIFLLPISICALVLYFTYRQPSDIAGT